MSGRGVENYTWTLADPVRKVEFQPLHLIGGRSAISNNPPRVGILDYSLDSRLNLWKMER
jgi:hypothetical protein